MKTFMGHFGEMFVINKENIQMKLNELEPIYNAQLARITEIQELIYTKIPSEIANLQKIHRELILQSVDVNEAGILWVDGVRKVDSTIAKYESEIKDLTERINQNPQNFDAMKRRLDLEFLLNEYNKEIDKKNITRQNEISSLQKKIEELNKELELQQRISEQERKRFDEISRKYGPHKTYLNLIENIEKYGSSPSAQEALNNAINELKKIYAIEDAPIIKTPAKIIEVAPPKTEITPKKSNTGIILGLAILGAGSYLYFKD